MRNGDVEFDPINTCSHVSFPHPTKIQQAQETTSRKRLLTPILLSPSQSSVLPALPNPTQPPIPPKNIPFPMEQLPQTPSITALSISPSPPIDYFFLRWARCQVSLDRAMG